MISEGDMNVLKVWIVSITTTGLLFSTAFAADATKGKALFNDSKLGASGKSCNSCHADGSGLEKAGGKKEFKLMGKTVTRLEDAVNICIERRMKGKALGPKSADMANLTAYIKSLKGKASIFAPKKRTAATGC